MRDKALYHLLMARAHGMAGQMGDDPFLDALRASLTVDYAKRTYTLRWSFAGAPYHLDIQHDRFTFYAPGDKGRTDAHATANVRADNWKAAGALLEQMAQTSGTTLTGNPNAASLSIFPAAQTVPAPHGYAGTALWGVGFAVTAAVLGWLTFPGFTLQDGLAAAGAGILLCLIALRAAATDPDPRFGVAGALLTAAAPVAAVCLTGGAWAPLAFVAPFALAVELEWRGIDVPAAGWLAPGLAGALPLFVLGAGGLVPVGALALFVWIFAVLAPIRFRRPQVLYFTFGTIAAVAAAVALGWLTPDTAAPVPGTGYGYAVLAGAAPLSAVAVIFGVMRGSMFLVLPWGMLIAIFCLALMALIGGRAGPGTAVLGMGGYLIFHVTDGAIWAIRSARKRIISG